MCLYPITLYTRLKDGTRKLVTVSCGKCLQCMQRSSIEWAFRIMLEAKQYSDNCFITLTFNEEHLPSPPSISRSDVQTFMKSLRDKVKPVRVRFFASGEYGSHFGRPHYHIIVFGWKPSDLVPLRSSKRGQELFRSNLVEDVWKKGFISVGDLTYDSALYCAKYMQKFQFLRSSRFVVPEHPELLPPFIQMSNRPGIGYNAVYSCNLDTDRIYISGRSCKIPRYFLKVMERDGIFLDGFKLRRQVNGEHLSSCMDIRLARKRYYDMFHSKVLRIRS